VKPETVGSGVVGAFVGVVVVGTLVGAAVGVLVVGEVVGLSVGT